MRGESWLAFVSNWVKTFLGLQIFQASLAFSVLIPLSCSLHYLLIFFFIWKFKHVENWQRLSRTSGDTAHEPAHFIRMSLAIDAIFQKHVKFLSMWCSTLMSKYLLTTIYYICQRSLLTRLIIQGVGEGECFHYAIIPRGWGPWTTWTKDRCWKYIACERMGREREREREGETVSRGLCHSATPCSLPQLIHGPNRLFCVLFPECQFSLCACASLAHDNSNAANPTGITMSAIIFNWAAHYRSENPQVYKYNVSITTGFPFLFLPQPSPLHTYFCIPPVSLITLL